MRTYFLTIDAFVQPTRLNSFFRAFSFDNGLSNMNIMHKWTNLRKSLKDERKFIYIWLTWITITLGLPTTTTTMIWIYLLWENFNRARFIRIYVFRWILCFNFSYLSILFDLQIFSNSSFTDDRRHLIITSFISISNKCHSNHIHAHIMFSQWFQSHWFNIDDSLWPRSCVRRSEFRNTKTRLPTGYHLNASNNKFTISKHFVAVVMRC